MKFRTLLSTLILATALSANAEIRGEWTMYPTFGATPGSLVVTPDKVYMAILAQPVDGSGNYSEYQTSDMFLFGYDIDADELITYSRSNYLSDHIVTTIQYNPKQKYLFIGYENGNIDLLYSDNSVVNIPTLKDASVNTTKHINSVTFDRERNRAYVATDFGFLIIDGESGKVLDSRNYNKKFTYAGRVGSKFILFDETQGYWVNDGDKAYTFSDYSVVPGLDKPSFLAPLDGEKFGCVSSKKICVCTINDDELEVTTLSSMNPSAISNVKEGYMFDNKTLVRLLKFDGSMEDFNNLPESENKANTLYSSYDGKEFWGVEAYKGLFSLDRPSETSSSWTVTRNGILPNSPAVYRASEIAYSPKYGMVVNNIGTNKSNPSYQMYQPTVTCGLKDGVWTQYGYAYTKPEWIKTSYDPSGVAFDPDNADVIYYGSYTSGIQRKNLADLSDMTLMSHPADANSKLPEWQKIAETCTWAFTALCNFSQPRFDSDGNMFANHFGGTSNNTIKVHVWTPEARRANRFTDYTVLQITNAQLESNHTLLPLKKMKNVFLVSDGRFSSSIYVYDTNGTPKDASDDRYVRINGLKDQDGNRIEDNFTNCLYEDMSTGNVYVGTRNGMYYFNPRTALQGDTHVTRIKVARDDGTNLADYLLDNVPVNAITSDGDGRMWYSTGGGGLVCTSPDGHTIHAEINTSNSQIPSDIVNYACYNPENNSMLIATAKGLAEFRISGGSGDTSSSSGQQNKAHIYPNPVRPDYLGWINIENIPDGSLVKIVDASGNLIKELGPASSGMVRWDATNMSMKRVKSGVYHVFSSPTSESGDQTVTGKILIVN